MTTDAPEPAPRGAHPLVLALIVASLVGLTAWAFSGAATERSGPRASPYGYEGQAVRRIELRHMDLDADPVTRHEQPELIRALLAAMTEAEVTGFAGGAGGWRLRLYGEAEAPLAQLWVLPDGTWGGAEGQPFGRSPLLAERLRDLAPPQ